MPLEGNTLDPAGHGDLAEGICQEQNCVRTFRGPCRRIYPIPRASDQRLLPNCQSLAPCSMRKWGLLRPPARRYHAYCHPTCEAHAASSKASSEVSPSSNFVVVSSIVLMAAMALGPWSSRTQSSGGQGHKDLLRRRVSSLSDCFSLRRHPLNEI
jgi:hypothetical protein